MRILTLFAAAAPLALLAACGDNSPAEEAAAPVEAGPAAQVAAADDPAPQAAPLNSLEGVDFAGDYSLTDESGQTSRVTLRADDTYDYTAPDGTTRSGTYSRTEDGNRIMIEDFDGRAGYFSVGDGALYRLENESTPYDQITVSGTYRRDFAPTPQGGPGATTNSVADKRS